MQATRQLDLLSLRLILLRYGLAVLLMWVAVLAHQPDAFYFVIIAAIISLKFLFYDSVVYVIRRKWRSLRIIPWLMVGYIITLALDITAAWSSASRNDGTSFALLVPVFFTPWILFGALIAIVGGSMIASRSVNHS